MQIVTNAYPHNWTWHLSRAEGSPWNDVRVRKAANLAVDREGMKELLGGLMIPRRLHAAKHQCSAILFKLKAISPRRASFWRSGLRTQQAVPDEDPDLAVGLGQMQRWR